MNRRELFRKAGILAAGLPLARCGLEPALAQTVEPPLPAHTHVYSAPVGWEHKHPMPVGWEQTAHQHCVYGQEHVILEYVGEGK